MKCFDCDVVIHEPKDAKRSTETWVCPRCFGDRWRAAGCPADDRTGQINLTDEAGRRVRWANVEAA